MGRTLLSRIERAEQLSATRSRVSADCICFPVKEQPRFNWPVEQQIAAQVKCPLHGERFHARFSVYVSKWLRVKRENLLQTRQSKQYVKAWHAGFPGEQWPGEELSINEEPWLRLKDGTLLPVL